MLSLPTMEKSRRKGDDKTHPRDVAKVSGQRPLRELRQVAEEVHHLGVRQLPRSPLPRLPPLPFSTGAATTATASAGTAFLPVPRRAHNRPLFGVSGGWCHGRRPHRDPHTSRTAWIHTYIIAAATATTSCSSCSARPLSTTTRSSAAATPAPTTRVGRHTLPEQAGGLGGPGGLSSSAATGSPRRAAASGAAAVGALGGEVKLILEGRGLSEEERWGMGGVCERWGGPS